MLCIFANNRNCPIMQKEKISRRDALKRMGITIAGMSLVTVGTSMGFSACASNSEKKRLVFFFTGTGNSLYVAKLFTEKPLAIPQVLKEEKTIFEADEIGLVFPDYRADAPPIVKEFIQKVKLKASYLFTVITFGNYDCNVVETWHTFAHEQGLDFDYITTVKMVDNYLPVFDMNNQRKQDKKEDERFTKIQREVNENKKHIPWLTEEERTRALRILGFVPPLYPLTSKELLKLNTDDCIGCGICTEVCPRKCLSLTGKGLTMSDGACEFCLACVQNCPQKALVLRRGERNSKARYRHPEISLNEIIRANRQ